MFSESLELGNSTLFNIDKEEKRAMQPEKKENESIIMESPKDLPANKTRFNRTKLRSSVPDSCLAEIRVSQFEEKFREDEVDASNIDGILNASISVLDAPICTEDVKDLLDVSEEVPLDVEEIEAPDILQLLDSSSFICPPEDKATAEMLKKTLERSRLEIIETLQEPNLPNNAKKSIKNLSEWGLPVDILEEYQRMGVKEMFEWQVECLSNPKVLIKHRNLVYSAPTSAGKTLVSEILLLKTVLERKKKALLILPFISVVREKMLYLQDLLNPSGYRVEGFFGGYNPPGGLDSINVVICTIEKANSIVNKLLEQKKLDDIGLVIVDEIHLISDPGRGYILELLLAKVLYMTRKHGFEIQVITMSATLANTKLLKCWLDAESYKTDFRPVALQEMIKIGSKIFDADMKQLRDLKFGNSSLLALQNDPDHISYLCIETLLENCSVIVFCPSKNWCENLAKQLAGSIRTLGRSGDEIGSQIRQIIKRSKIDELKSQFRDTPIGLDVELEKTITFACAFHHAGLTAEERELIENGFKAGVLKIIVATSTLSSGVNLPARRVIIRTPLFGGKKMCSLTYRQMIGRAGRTGKDTIGESILICTQANERIGRELVKDNIKSISSCLEVYSHVHLKRAILEIIASGVAATKEDLNDFFKCTLLSAEKKMLSENNSVAFSNFSEIVMEFLLKYEFVRTQKCDETEEENYIATHLGMACLASSIPPTDGLLLFNELQKAMYGGIVLMHDFHVIYLVTPYSVCYQLQDIDWIFFLHQWDESPIYVKNAAKFVGVDPAFMQRALRGQRNLDPSILQIHKRFFTALALHELVNETPISTVAEKYSLSRGILQSLQQMTSTFAGIVAAFCKSLKWNALEIVIGSLKERIFFGVHHDLIDLMRLPDLNQKRARALHNAGIETVVELANSDIMAVEKALHNSISFDSAKQYEKENSYDAAERINKRILHITGKPGLTVAEAATLLVQQARAFMKHEIGVEAINWSSDGDEGLKDVSETKANKRKVLEEMNEVQTDEVTPPKLCKLSEKASPKKLKRPASITAKSPSRNGRKAIKPSAANEGPSSSEKENYQDKNLIPVADPYASPARVSKDASPVPSKLKSILSKLRKAMEDKPSPDERQPKSVCIESCHDGSISAGTYASPTRQCEDSSLAHMKSLSPPRNLLSALEDQSAPVNHRLNSSPIESSHDRNTKPDADPYASPERNTKTNDNTYASPARPLKQSLPFHEKSDAPSRDLSEVLKVPFSPVNRWPHVTSIESCPTPLDPNRSPDQIKCSSPPISSSTNNTNTSTTRFEKPKLTMRNSQNIFMTDESFEMNSDIAALLQPAEHVLLPNQQINKNENSSIESPTMESNITSAVSPRLQHSIHKLDPRRTSTMYSDTASSPIMLISIDPPENFSVDESHSLSNAEAINIIPLCSKLDIEKALNHLMKEKCISCCLALQKIHRTPPVIGGHLLDAEEQENSMHESLCFEVDNAIFLSGISFCTEGVDVFYLNMQQTEITVEEKVELLNKIFGTTSNYLYIFDCKEQLKLLRKAIPYQIDFNAKFRDPKVANWIIQPDVKRSLWGMVEKFAPEMSETLPVCDRNDFGLRSYGQDTTSTKAPEIRSSVEACVVLAIIKKQMEYFCTPDEEQRCIWFQEKEMPLQVILAEMEIIGFPVRVCRLRDLRSKLEEQLKAVASKIYCLNHNERFNINSAVAVAKVLGIHQKWKRASTSRQVLEKLNTPIAKLVITYRKLKACQDIMSSLLTCVKNERIHCSTTTFTSTGRISMAEPSLQNVPKDFIVDIDRKITISCRSPFEARNGCDIVSADYCQLEMRILAHYSKDDALLKVMKSRDDIFVSMAAAWNNIPVDQVTEDQRNSTKKICYGIVYGMSYKTLAEDLHISESEAVIMSEQFHSTYPGIRTFTQYHIRETKRKGYVETIWNRRRYLPDINSDDTYARAKAERQALNTLIQGTAADILKVTILRMKKHLIRFPKIFMVDGNMTARLIMPLHDELLFEVTVDKVQQLVHLLVKIMINVVTLKVPLRVKVHQGRNWGEMKEIKIPQD